MIEQITAKELRIQMEALPEQRFCFLVKHVLQVDDGMDCESMQLTDVLKLGLADWMTKLSVMDGDNQQKIFAEFSGAFQKYVLQKADTGRWPVAQLGILDFRWVVLNPVFTDGKGFYDLQKDRWTRRLPYHALTLLYCDLSALLSRLSDRIERTRKKVEELTDGP